MKILVVDDTEMMRIFLERLLNIAGYDDVVTASGAMEAFEILGMKDKDTVSTEIGLIFMDVVMPGISGLTACKKIREKEYLKTVLIVIVSGKDDKADIQTAREVGASHYLVKPVDKGEFQRIMKDIEGGSWKGR